MSKNTTPMRQWMNVATPEEQEQMAMLAGTTRAMLYQYSGGHRTMSAERAGVIEAAAAKMRRTNRKLPKLFRIDLAPACRSCPYARQCLANVSSR